MNVGVDVGAEPLQLTCYVLPRSLDRLGRHAEPQKSLRVEKFVPVRLAKPLEHTLEGLGIVQLGVAVKHTTEIALSPPFGLVPVGDRLHLGDGGLGGCWFSGRYSLPELPTRSLEPCRESLLVVHGVRRI